VPFLANELHEQLTGTPAEDAPWPTADDTLADRVVEVEERQIERLADDINDIVDVTGTDPSVIRVYVAADWKHDVFETVADVGTDVGAVMGEVMQDPDLRERGNAVNDLVGELTEQVRGRDETVVAAMAAMDERAVYEDAVGFLEREFDANVELYAEDDPDRVDPADRASGAVPFRPAVHIE
jgi:leucyl-tRNA synthetase